KIACALGLPFVRRASGLDGSRGCCSNVTVRLLNRFPSAASIDRRLRLWLGLLAALAALNGAIWIWVARSASQTPYAQTQLLLSGVYVGVAGFRSLFPRVDVERMCVWDTWLSAIFLGRTAATIAELCFALQCALFVHRLAEIVGMPLLAVEARLF